MANDIRIQSGGNVDLDRLSSGNKSPIQETKKPQELYPTDGVENQAKQQAAQELLAQNGALQQFAQETGAGLTTEGAQSPGANLTDHQKELAARLAALLTAQLNAPSPATESSGSSNSGNSGQGQSGNSALESVAKQISENPQFEAIIRASAGEIYAPVQNWANNVNERNQAQRDMNTCIGVYNSYSGEKFEGKKKVPVYQYDIDKKTGKVTIKQVGYAEKTYDEIKAEKDNMVGFKDSISSLSQEAMTQLQIFGDKAKQYEEALSNILKKGGDTAQGIIGNLK